MFFNPEVALSSEVESSIIGTFEGKAPLFCPVARLYVMIIVFSIISMSLTFSGRCADIVAFEGSPA